MSFHLYRIAEIFSNGSGTIQFIELHVGNANGEGFWAGHTLTVSNGTATHTFSPTDLPSTNTANTSVLIATQGFANLGLVAPDFIVPDNFLFTSGGTITINWGEGVDVVTYDTANLPTDGVHSLVRGSNTVFTTVATGHPQDFAGAQADMPLPQVNVINGTEGPDSLTGTADADQIHGFGGNDTLAGAGGGDVIDGGSGTDTVMMGVALSAVQSYSLGANVEVVTTAGHVVMSGVERIEFTNALFALDTGVGQSVWQAEALLWAGFGSEPGMSLLSQWTAVADTAGGMQAVAQQMLNTYAPGISSDALVRYLYGTILGGTPSDDQVQQYVAMIGPGHQFANNAAFLAFAAGTDFNTERMAGFVGSVQSLDPAFF